MEHDFVAMDMVVAVAVLLKVKPEDLIRLISEENEKSKVFDFKKKMAMEAVKILSEKVNAVGKKKNK